MPETIVPSAADEACETWRAIPHVPDYEVSDLGNVRSLHTAPPRPIQPYAGGRYITATLRVDGIGKTFAVHVLVARAFLGERPAGKEIRHLNGNAHDNRLANLAWGTRSQNVLDEVAHGTHRNARKVACGCGLPWTLRVRPNGRKQRVCRPCEARRSREYYAAKKAGKGAAA